MNLLIDNIFEAFMMEGGNAVHADRIPASAGPKIFAEVEDKLERVSGYEMRLLGSVGKKADPDTNGDIDIAVLTSDKSSLIDCIEQAFPDCEMNDKTGPGIVSIGYPYELHSGRSIVAQVDFMMVDDLEWAEFFYGSPDYTKNESVFKAALRNWLMSITFSCLPVGELPKTDEEGRTIAKWKYAFSAAGVNKQWLEYTGRGGAFLKSPKKVKELEQFVTKNWKEVLGMVFKNPDRKQFTSVETLWAALHSNEFLYGKGVLAEIEQRFEDEALASIGKSLDDFKAAIGE